MKAEQKATCHPDRKHKAFGLCLVCYTNKNKEKKKIRQRVWRSKNIEKSRKYTRDFMRRNREKIQPYKNYRRWLRRVFLDIFKLSEGCFDCGYNKRPEALQFDHLRDKSFTVGEGGDRPWLKLFEEIEKCQVVCANCHTIRTKQRRNEDSVNA